MNLIKCGLCGFEFERGAKICRGCHGHIKYGAGGLKWFFGTLYGGVIWYLLTYINDNWYGIKDSVGGTIILVFFILGCIHAAYMFRKKVNTVKAIDD